MRKADLVNLLRYDPATGALTWRDTKQSAIVPTPRGPHVQYGNQSFVAVRLVWLIAWGKIPPRVTFLNGDRYDLRLCNMRFLSPDEYRAHNRTLKQDAARAASRDRQSLPKGVMQCRKTGLYYSRVLVAGRIEETKRVADPREAARLRHALLLTQR